MEFESVLEKIKKGLKEGAALSMEKIEEYTKIGKLKVEEFSAKRKIERNYVDIGERVYELISEEKGSTIEKDIIVTNAFENVKSLKDELEAIEKKIQDIAEQSLEQYNKEEDCTGSTETSE